MVVRKVMSDSSSSCNVACHKVVMKWPCSASAAGKLVAACSHNHSAIEKRRPDEKVSHSVDMVFSADTLSVGVMPLSLIDTSRPMSIYVDHNLPLKVVVCSTFRIFFDIQTMAMSGLVTDIFLSNQDGGQNTNQVQAAYRTRPETILLLPRNFDGSDYGQPCSSWSRRICKLAYDYKSLLTASAYLSTLGGGWFMTRRVGNAQVMAREQLKIARSLGDHRLEVVCHVHLVYSDIQLGRFDQARSLLDELLKVARFKLHDEKLASIVSSAIHYNDHAAETVRRKRLEPVHVGKNTSGEGNLKDDFYRLRVIIEDELN